MRPIVFYQKSVTHVESIFSLKIWFKKSLNVFGQQTYLLCVNELNWHSIKIV